MKNGIEFGIGLVLLVFCFVALLYLGLAIYQNINSNSMSIDHVDQDGTI